MPFLVVNPRAGGGKTQRAFPELRRTIEAALGPCDAALTERPGHGVELARAAADAGERLVVAVGGDGTFNEVVNGVLGSSRARDVEVAIVGQGTGGDLLRTLGLEHRLDKYLEAIASGRVRRLDAGRARYVNHDGGPAERWFVNILSAGMGGLVDQYVAGASRALGGKAAYFGASVKALATCRRGRLACTVDGEKRELTSYMIAICNGRYFGSGMKIAPDAAIDDGRFEIVSIDAPSKAGLLVNSNRIYGGSHIGKPGVIHLPCTRRVELDLLDEDARDRFLIDCDGEPLGRLPLAIDVVRAAVALRG